MIDPMIYLGTPYRFGARGPDAFDCWGLVLDAASSIGLIYPDWADANGDYSGAKAKLWMERSKHMWFHVDKDETREGDVVVCNEENGAAHAAICLYQPGYLMHTHQTSGVLVEDFPSLARRFARTRCLRHK